ncbi:MAG: LCP family protein [Clostridiales bacterium]|nr:LCP family protein [Candidatus Equinaster intestinalis]
MGKNEAVYKKRKVKKGSHERKPSTASYEQEAYYGNAKYGEDEYIDINSFSTVKKEKPKKTPKTFIGRFWEKREKWQKIVIIAVLVLAILCSAGYAVFNYYASKINRDDDFNKLNDADLGIDSVIDENVFNIALFGIDTRDVNGTQSNSDSMMILSLNKKNNTIKLVSIMRDSFVPTERNGQKIYAKINAAYSYGGPANAVKTINKCFGLDISEYATVNFFGMADIIDAVGGVYCKVTYDEIHCKISINEHIRNQCHSLKIDPTPYLVKKEGEQLLNGIQAVAYARIRYAKNWQGTSNDFGRTERQRYVMQQLLDKALEMDFSSYPSLVDKLAPLVKTSFSNKELLSLASFLRQKPTMETSRVPSNEYIINSDFRPYGGSTVYYNYEYAGKVLKAFLYDGITPEDYIKQNGVDKTEWFNVKSGGGSIKTTSKSNSGSKKQNDDDDDEPLPVESEMPVESEPEIGDTSSGEPVTSETVSEAPEVSSEITVSSTETSETETTEE